jgi:hypothetical protein
LIKIHENKDNETWLECYVWGAHPTGLLIKCCIASETYLPIRPSRTTTVIIVTAKRGGSGTQHVQNSVAWVHVLVFCSKFRICVVVDHNGNAKLEVDVDVFVFRFVSSLNPE